MFPRHEPHWHDEDQPELGVLVPGMMGIGLVISVLMLVAEVVGKVIPLAGRRRTAELVKLSAGRVNDAQSIWDGAPPAVGVVLRVPRRRLTSAAFALSLVALATVSVVKAIDVAATIGDDRRLWALGAGVLVAVAAAVLAAIWLLAAITGPAAPRWLRWLHQFWPLGVLPALHPSTKE